VVHLDPIYVKFIGQGRGSNFKITGGKPGIERVQALADISRSALCCPSDETRAPTGNPPNNAQLKGTPYHSSMLHRGLCSSAGMRRGTDRETDRHRRL